jgi:hypothetical protein
MSKATGLNFETIEYPYDNNLDRIEVDSSILDEKESNSGVLSPSGNPPEAPIGSPGTFKDGDDSKEIFGNDFKDLWISSWIKSRNYKPKTQGFLIDGKLGYIECMQLYVGSGGIEGGSLHIPDKTTTNSFHIDAIGLSWAGANVADKATAPYKLSPEGEMTLGDPTGTHLQLSGPNVRIQSSNYVSGAFGSGFYLDSNLLEVGNIACRGLVRTAVFQKDVISAMGGNFMVLGADVLDANMTAADNSTLMTKATTTFSVGDILRIKEVHGVDVDDEWMEVTAVNGAIYTVTRDKKGDYVAGTNPTWKKGATVVNYGQSGDGGIFMTASESNAPYLSVFTHAGSPWTDLTERLRIGNLNGFAGEGADLYGIKIGDASNFFKYDPTDGMLIEGGKIQTGTTGERIIIEVDNIVAFDANNKLRMATDAGQWTFWDENEVASGGFHAVGTGSMLFGSYGNLGLNADDGAGTIHAVGTMISNTDALYDLGTRPNKWGDIYVEEKIRFNYTSVNHISVIDDSDNAYARIRFDASSGSIGFGRSIYPISDDTYNLGITSTNKWKNFYLTGYVEFETIADAGFKWDVGGDNAQFFYYNDGNYFVLTKPLSANSEKIINVTDPTANQDAATKKYVDDNIPAAGANTALSNLASVAVNTALLPAGAGAISLGSSTNYWNTLRLGSNVYFYGTTSKGLIWDSAGDNAQFYYDNANNKFITNKSLTANGIDISAYASAYNTHVSSANSHHAQSHSHGSHTSIGANDHHAQSHSHSSHTSIGASDHHSSTSSGIAINPSGISSNGNVAPSSSNSRYCGTSGAYWARVYSDAYFTKNTSWQTGWDKYDDLQIVRDLKTIKDKNKSSGYRLDASALPKEISDKGFTDFGGLASFNLCVSKKIVECVDDLKKTIDILTNRLNKLEKI